MTFAMLFILLVNCVVVAHSARVRGKFGDQRFSIDVEFGDDWMNVTMHRPVNAPEDFRETINFHDFPKHLVAMKNTIRRHCYVRYFVESEDLMRGRVESAEYNNGMMGNLTEERMDLDGIPALSSRLVHILFGERIADFCKDHEVYVFGDMDYVVLDPKGLHVKERKRRSLNSFVVSGTCSCSTTVIIFPR